MTKLLHAGEIPAGLHVIRHIDDFFKGIHIRFAGGVALDSIHHCLIFPKNPLGNQTPRQRMERFGIIMGKIIQYFTIFPAQSQLQGAIQCLCNIVE